MIQKHSLLGELLEYCSFLKRYIQKRLLGWGGRFERAKDIVVAFLVVKRGKYSQSFLNTSFLILVSAVLIAGPIIIENNPFISDYLNQNEQGASAVIATDINNMSFRTTISQKPRDKVIEHIVKSGETLASIGDRYDISVDTIKWANDLKNDTIKPGQSIKILPITGIAHTVKSGESIYSIAKRYNVDAQQIVNFQFNEFEDLDTFALKVGQTLYVPEGTPPQAPKPRGVSGPVQIVVGRPGSGRFIWPTSGNVTQRPVYYHMALDIANKALPPVVAADTGTVSYSACLGYGYGCHIIVDHGNGFQTLYAHLSELGVSVGQGVSQGQAIGRVGSTGRSTGPHLHFEIRSGGALQNPLNYLQ